MARIARNRNRAKQASIPAQAAKVALYLRVSTERQADDGNGLDSQRAALLARCEREGWTDITEFEDAGISGKSTDRPQFQAMMEAARAGVVQVVMAAKLDRIARNTIDFLQTADELTRAGVRLVMLEPDIDLGTDTGRVMATMFAAFAEWERKLIGNRVMGGKVEQAKQGEFNGSPIPFGYAPDWTILPDEAAVVTRIFAEWNDGKPLSHIAGGLNQDGITTRNGKAWKHQQVLHIVRNGTYAGLRQWNGGETMPTVKDAAGNDIPALAAIVTLEVYRQAEKRQPKRGNPRGNPTFGRKA